MCTKRKSRFKRVERLRKESGGGGGALPSEPIRDMPFFRVSFFSINSRTGYETLPEILKHVMTVCSRTIVYYFGFFVI